MSVRKEAPGDAEEQFSVTDWDQNMKFSGLSSLASYNVGNSNIIDRLPSLSRFGSDSLSEIMSSLGLPYDTQMQEFPSAGDRAVERNIKGKKRKKLSAFDDQSVEDEARNNVPAEIATKAMERDEKKPKNGANPSVKGDGDVPKEDFVHVRARRGQATNSHSLAERVRREKISERMKLLQDLVPGCNKITGKAVMLDEIINYVQSLQKQVEFLSMKLATVNPEFDMDLEQIFSKENRHTRYGSSPALGYAHPELQLGMLAASLQNPGDHFLRIATNSQISSMAQVTNAWGNELQNAIQRGLIPNLPIEGIELNSSMKVEL